MDDVDQSLPTHAVKAVIQDGQNRILFLQRSGSVANWDLPGGLVEPDENEPSALRREILEELGVDSIIGKKLGKWSFFRPLDGATVTVTNYASSLTSYDIKLSSEHTAFMWASPDAIRTLAVKDLSLYDALNI